MADQSTASIDLAQLDKLEALANAATRGPWKRAERLNGPFWHISSEHTIGGEPCKSGRQAIASVHGESKRGATAYAAMFKANADFIAAANPATVQQLIALARRSLTSGTPADLKYLTRYGVGGDGELQEMVCGDAYLVKDVEELFAAAIQDAAAPIEIEGLGRISDEDDGYLTLQFKDENAAQAFMQKYGCSVEVDDMPPMRDFAAPTCPTCKGNDQDAPCAYPSEGKPGCLRDIRLAAAKSAPQYSTITDHNGKVTGVRFDNMDQMPLAGAAAKSEHNAKED